VFGFLPQVGVCWWQFGQRNRRFDSWLSLLFPFL